MTVFQGKETTASRNAQSEQNFKKLENDRVALLGILLLVLTTLGGPGLENAQSGENTHLDHLPWHTLQPEEVAHQALAAFLFTLLFFF